MQNSSRDGMSCNWARPMGLPQKSPAPKHMQSRDPNHRPRISPPGTARRTTSRSSLALAARASGTPLPPSEENEIHEKLMDRLPSNKGSFYTASQYYAAQDVQAAIRGLIAREKEKKIRADTLNSAPDSADD